MSLKKSYALTDADGAVALDPKDLAATLGRLITAPATVQSTLPDALKALIMNHSADAAGAKLRASLISQFGIRVQSTGDAANRPQNRTVMQTLDASSSKPYLINFDQIVIDPFTGPGQFDLVERDSSDVPGGESEVTIATKSGFSDGVTAGNWSHIVKSITGDKIYSVVFVPGTAGDGIYSISVRAIDRLIPGGEDQ